jgi:molybdopterin-guanine dinucleotide biosynthesis protein A
MTTAARDALLAAPAHAPTPHRPRIHAAPARAGRGARAVAGFADAIRMRRVDFSAGKWDPFLNIDTPEDLARGPAPPPKEGQP